MTGVMNDELRFPMGSCTNKYVVILRVTCNITMRGGDAIRHNGDAGVRRGPSAGDVTRDMLMSRSFSYVGECFQQMSVQRRVYNTEYSIHEGLIVADVIHPGEERVVAQYRRGVKGIYNKLRMNVMG